jgi:hypothetical protein
MRPALNVLHVRHHILLHGRSPIGQITAGVRETQQIENSQWQLLGYLSKFPAICHDHAVAEMFRYFPRNSFNSAAAATTASALAHALCATSDLQKSSKVSTAAFPSKQ